MRIGIGYDSHRFEANIPLYLGGIKIDYGRGLKGHSDGDAAIHSIIDAILTAAHMDNIGKLFPDSDKLYENIRSTVLLKLVSESIKKSGFIIVNCSTVIIAEAPKLSDYIEKMESIIANILKVTKNQVSISAKTDDKMGAIGKGEGIAVYSVCLLEE